MNISKKILLGYGVVLVPLFAVLVYALSSIDQMDRINETIVRVNNPLIERSERLLENLLGQEFYSRRLAILKDNESLKLLQMRIGEFDRLLREVLATDSSYASVQELSAKGTAFLTLLSGGYSSLDAALTTSEKQVEIISQKRKEMINLVKLVNAEVHRNMNRKNELSAAIGMRSYKVLLSLGIGSILLTVVITSLFARSISRSVGQLKLSILRISNGKFDNIRNLDSSDEFSEVSRSIADMAKKIAHLEKLNIATSPLTLLPGGLTIDETIRARLDASLPTALCMIDIDNFKVFNDRYGFARGNEVIQAMAMIVKAASKELGTPDDFVGHIGGDDFIVVTSPEAYEIICKVIVKNFDEKSPEFYDPDDRQRGSIIGKNRQGEELVFPLMSVSIGVATDHGGSIKDPLVLSRQAAELKEHAKSVPGSVYSVDRRQHCEGDEA